MYSVLKTLPDTSERTVFNGSYAVCVAYIKSRATDNPDVCFTLVKIVAQYVNGEVF